MVDGEEPLAIGVRHGEDKLVAALEDTAEEGLTQLLPTIGALRLRQDMQVGCRLGPSLRLGRIP